MEIDHNFIYTFKTFMLDDTDMLFYLPCASELSDTDE